MIIVSIASHHQPNYKIKAAEKYAAENGVNEIWIHSQEQAAGFYSALGYKDTGIHDVEEGCPHILMKKVL